MNKVKAEDIKIGMGLKTWFGSHTIVDIEPYKGTFDFILNVLVFSNSTKMSNESGAMYNQISHKQKIKKQPVKKHKISAEDINRMENQMYMRGIRGLDF